MGVSIAFSLAQARRSVATIVSSSGRSMAASSIERINALARQLSIQIMASKKTCSSA